jgi:hypothetical protein
MSPKELIKSVFSSAQDTPPAVYQHTMFELGQQLGSAILCQIPDYQTNAYLACTAEDADFLARGMLTKLEANLAQVAFT